MLHNLLRFCLLLLLLPILAAAVPSPDLEPRDVAILMREVLQHHATYKRLDEVIVSRSLENFVEELDPAKTYFTRTDVERWLDPSPALVKEVLHGYHHHDYSHFATIYDEMVVAVERRQRIESEIAQAELPKGVDSEEFKDLDWAANELALRERLLKLRALQVEASQKLVSEEPTLVLERLNKRRHHREEKILGESAVERERLVLVTVLKATTSALDSQTAYFTPEEATDFVSQLQKRLSGIGVQMRDNLNGFTVVQVIEGGPAYAQDALRTNDCIVGVNGESVVGMDILDAVQLIRGPAGTSVKLTILRERIVEGEKFEERHEVSVVRGEVMLKETRIEVTTEAFGDGVIGHVALHSFYQDRDDSSTSDVKQAIAELKAEHNLKGLILDLRNNTGGILRQAVDITGLFITKGVVVSIRDFDGRVHHLRDFSGEVAWDGPLVVLTSRASASASEIVAQCLQDYGRALIVGDRHTYGKGTFQTSTLDIGTLTGADVNPKGEFKVTRGIYYTVSGKSPQLRGVQADVIVPGIYSELELGEQFSKFPLNSDEIKPNFSDDLSDLPLGERPTAMRTYRFNLQSRLTTYTEHLTTLSENSGSRVDENPDYQLFLSILRGEANDEERSVAKNDFQLIETYNIMKDLILLTEARPARAA